MKKKKKHLKINVWDKNDDDEEEWKREKNKLQKTIIIIL